MNKLREILTQLLNVLAGVSFLVMVVLTCWQVLLPGLKSWYLTCLLG